MYIAISNSIGASSRVNAGGGGGGGFTNTYSLDFDGVDDNVDVPYNSSLDVVTSPHSLSFWLKTTDGSTQVVMEKGRGDELAVFIISNKIYWGGANGFYGGTTVVNDGNWHNIIFVAGGSGVGSTIYIDGSSVATGNLKVQASANTDDFVIGTDANGGNAYDGNLDEIAIFNYALTSENVTSIYNSGVPNNLDDLTTPPTLWLRNGDNGSYKSPQWLIPNNSNVANSRISNYSFSFDGVDDIINVPYNSSLNVVTGNHSLSFWLKTTDGTTQIVTEKGSSDELAAWIVVGGSIRWAGANTFNSSTSVNDGNWKHIVFVADGSTSYIYVNGSLDATGGNKIQASANASDFVIGARANNSFNYQGQLDEIAIFNVALTQENVTAIYNSGTPADISSLSPISHWRMGEEATFSTNWSLPDNGSASNTGTSANMTIEDRVGNASGSSNNSLSYNMTESDREEDTPS